MKSFFMFDIFCRSAKGGNLPYGKIRNVSWIKMKAEMSHGTTLRAKRATFNYKLGGLNPDLQNHTFFKFRSRVTSEAVKADLS